MNDEELNMNDDESMSARPPRFPRHRRFVILGAGPGGLQMGYFLNELGLDYLILERSDRVGSFFHRFPRHRRLISINKKYNFFEEQEFNERHDWNSLLSDDPTLRFTSRSDELYPPADCMCDYLAEFASSTFLDIQLNAEVVQIRRRRPLGFELVISGGAVQTCDVLLLATGAVSERLPDIPGIEHVTTYGMHSIDQDRYRNKRVAILGHGNSAFETANHLAGVAAFVHLIGRGPLKWAWNTHFPGHLRAVNNDVIDMFQLKSLHAVLAPRLVRIDRVGDVLQTTHEYDYPDARTPGTLRLTREYDEIICATGFNWVPTDLFEPEIRPRTWADGKFPEMSAVWESTNVPDLFFVGGAMQGGDRKASSGFIHGFRYNIRTLSNLLAERYEGRPYPELRLGSFDVATLEEYLFRRVSTTAALYQLFGTLCDLIVIQPDLSECRVLQELPVRYVAEQDFGEAHVFAITLDFGFDQYRDPAVSFLGPSDPSNPDAAAFLHPVVTYRRGEHSEVFRFSDSLLGRWDLPHEKGGAVQERQAEFRRWISCLLNVTADEPVTGPSNYRPWTAEEVLAWADCPSASRPEAELMNPLSSADPRFRWGNRP